MFFFENKAPDKKPIMPKAIICHGVHGPCPKKNPDTKAVRAPHKNPDCLPNMTPVIIIMAAQGFT